MESALDAMNGSRGREMRTLFITLIATLTLAACGGNTEPAGASGKTTRLLASQRDAIDKAKGVSDTLRQADMVRRAQEENQIR